MRPAARCSITSAKDFSTVHRNQPSQTLSPRPSTPTRFMPSFQSPLPISGRLMRAELPRLIERAPAMFPQRRGLRGDGGTNMRSCSPASSSGPSRNGISSSRMRRVAGDLDVVRDHEGQPEQIVGAAGSHAHAGLGMPPVLDVAFEELARRRGQDMGPASVPARHRRKPSNPAIDRGSRTRRWIDTARSAPRSGSSASGRAASDSAANRWTAAACALAARPAVESHQLARRGQRALHLLRARNSGRRWRAPLPRSRPAPAGR